MDRANSRGTRPRRRWGAILLRVFVLAFLVAGGVAAYKSYRILKNVGGDKQSITTTMSQIKQGLVDNPRDAFPGKDRIYILGMGIDANYTSRDIMYTRNARSDTLFVASFDLVNRRMGMLSIPRDTRVEIAGHGRDKINAAHAYGGIPLAKSTVEEFLGVPIDYYAVIKIYGTRNFVDAIGGVDIDVEKNMDYDDNWGHLHIHLKKGMQHLNGEQAVGYVRFRHDADSDFGRMRRQQQLVKVVAQQLMRPSTLFNADQLVKVAKQNLETNLSEKQILALGKLFYNVTPDQIITASVPGEDYRDRSNGIWYLNPDEAKKEAMVHWVLEGEERYRNALITVRVQNASGVDGAASTVRDLLADQGYHAILGRTVRAAGDDRNLTRVIDLGNKPDAAKQISQLLPNAHLVPPAEGEVQRVDGPDILVYVGKDTAQVVARAGT